MNVTVKAIFTPRNGRPEVREVQLELRGDYVWMTGGPTGFESLPAMAHLDFEGQDRYGWHANVGNDRYAECVVPAAEMRRAFRALGVTE